MRTLVFVAREQVGLAQAFDLAVHLKKTGLVQTVALSAAVPGIEVISFPDDSPSVVQRGGAEATEQEIVTAFSAVGFELCESEEAPVGRKWARRQWQQSQGNK